LAALFAHRGILKGKDKRMFARLLKWCVVAEMAATILLGPAAAQAVTGTVTALIPANDSADLVPCAIFQINNQNPWYVLPQTDGTFAYEYLSLHDSLISYLTATPPGGFPVSFDVGGTDASCWGGHSVYFVQLGVGH
jgi:hypothetical protein